jgi:hypothetical protein
MERRYTAPSARGRRGGTPLPPRGAEQFPAAQRTSSDRLRVSAALLNGKASVPINYHAPTAKSTTHGEGSDQLQRTEGNSHPRDTGIAEAAGVWRPGPTVYVVFSFRPKDSSVTSEMVPRAFHGGGDIPPPSARGRRGVTPQTSPGAEQCPWAQRTSWDRLRVSAAFLHGKPSVPINYHAPTTKSTTHGEGNDQLTRTEGNSHPRHIGVAEAVGDWRPGPLVYAVCSFRLKDSQSPQ